MSNVDYETLTIGELLDQGFDLGHEVIALVLTDDVDNLISDEVINAGEYLITRIATSVHTSVVIVNFINADEDEDELFAALVTRDTLVRRFRL